MGIQSDVRGKGLRDNKGKPPLHFIPPSLMSYLGEHSIPTVWGMLDDGWCGKRSWTEVLWHVVDYFGENYMDEASFVFQFGAEKYAPFNWAKGMAWSIPLDCAMRHLRAHAHGEEADPESGYSHIGHLVCNLIMLAFFERTYPEGNDLPGFLAE